MNIPFGRRRLVVSVISAPVADGAGAGGNALTAAESDLEFARYAARRQATLERASWDIYSVMLQSPRIH